MFFYILIAILSLVVLITVHELGHFLMAKKFGVPVEEFGIGLPPRIFGFQFGQTLYSLNWLPFGAFVKIPALEGEDAERDERLPIYKRVLIFSGGVIATWIAAFLILTTIAGVWGLPFAASDDQPGQIQIMGVNPDSPAEEMGIKMGDIVAGGQINDQQFDFDQVDQMIDFLGSHRGQEVTLVIQRGTDQFNIDLAIDSDPEKEVLGVMIGSVVRQHYSWYQAPWAGLKATVSQTIAIPVVTVDVFNRLIQGENVPGARLVGPIGIVQIAGQQAAAGWDRLLMLVATIAIYLTIFNIIPLPALDGGRILFLIIEKVRGRAPSRMIENRINNVFFLLLIGLLIFVSIKDIFYLFS
jgi:regulator of sigma E protease